LPTSDRVAANARARSYRIRSRARVFSAFDRFPFPPPRTHLLANSCSLARTGVLCFRSFSITTAANARACSHRSDLYSLARTGVLYRNRFSPAPRERALLSFDNLQMAAYM
jgi:nucleotidyltransferase/DNA polymerase involved in DNA repair